MESTRRLLDAGMGRDLQVSLAQRNTPTRNRRSPSRGESDLSTTSKAGRSPPLQVSRLVREHAMRES
jgi:hypothetical protein